MNLGLGHQEISSRLETGLDLAKQPPLIRHFMDHHEGQSEVGLGIDTQAVLIALMGLDAVGHACASQNCQRHCIIPATELRGAQVRERRLVMRDQEKTKEQLIDELADLRRNLDALMNNLPEGVLIVDAPEVKIRMASRDACQMIGVSRNEFEGTQGEEHFRYYQAFLPNGEPAKMEQLPLARVLLRGEVIRNEEWLLHVRDGSKIPILCHAGPVRDQQGTITGGVISWQNVTDRKQAEETLRESEKRFRAIFEQAPLGIGLLDSHTGRFVQINPRYCEITGRTEEEMLTLDYQSITHPEDLQLCLDSVARLVEGQVRSCGWEKRYVRPDGSIVWVNLTLVALWDEDEQPRFHLTMVEDITERKRAEEALQKAHEELEAKVNERTAELAKANETLRNREYQLRNVLDTNPSIIFVKDRDSKILLGNEALARFYGIPLQQIVGTLHTDLHARLGMSPQEIAKWLADDRAAIDTGITQVFEERATWKDGSVHWYHTTKLQIALPSGQPGVLVVSEDITERKQAEDALRRSEGRLRLAQQVAGVGTFEWNVQTGVNTWTPEIEALYGLPPGGFPGTQPAWENLVYADDRTDAVRLAGRALETGEPVEGEWRVVWPDGSVHWLAGRWQAFKDDFGKPLRMIGVNIDITERKRAEEALRASEERYELAVRGAGVGIWDWDIRTGKLYLSPRWKTLFGYGENDIGGRIEDWARLIHPDERDWILKFRRRLPCWHITHGY